MKNLRTSGLLLLIIIAFVFSCRDDEYSLTNGELTPVGQPEIFVETNLSGLIKDENGLEIVDAIIGVEESFKSTNSDGFFTFQNINLSNNGTLVHIEKEGYFDNFKFANGWPGENSYISAKLVAKKSNSFNSSDPISLSTNGGGKIEFQASTFVDRSNEPYEGTVTVYHHWYDPTSLSLAETMPGDLRGLNGNEENVQLTTFGMMAVELEGALGQELKLREGTKAKLTFPVPTETDTEGLTVIPTWYLDEDNGKWIEEGEATLLDGNWVAEVTHFSFWNCDVPNKSVLLSGQLVKPNGTPISNQLIVATNNFNNTSATSISNQNGKFSGYVPIGVDLTLSIHACGGLEELVLVEALFDDKELGPITFDNNNHVEIKGCLVDCNSLAIENGYVIIESTSETFLQVADENGKIDFSRINCDAEGDLRAYDMDQGISSDPVKLDFTSELINLDSIELCNSNIPLNCYFELLCCPTSGFSLLITNGTAPYDVKLIDESGAIVFNESSVSAQIDIVVDAGHVYDAIIEDADGRTCISERELPQYLNSLQGKIWIDEENGIENIFDNDDTRLEGVKVTLFKKEGGNLIEIKSILSDDRGEYLFRNFMGGDYLIQVTAPSGLSFVDLSPLSVFNGSHIDPSMNNSSQSHSINSFDFDIIYSLNAGFKN